MECLKVTPPEGLFIGDELGRLGKVEENGDFSVTTFFDFFSLDGWLR